VGACVSVSSNTPVVGSDASSAKPDFALSGGSTDPRDWKCSKNGRIWCTTSYFEVDCIGGHTGAVLAAILTPPLGAPRKGGRNETAGEVMMCVWGTRHAPIQIHLLHSCVRPVSGCSCGTSFIAMVEQVLHIAMALRVVWDCACWVSLGWRCFCSCLC